MRWIRAHIPVIVLSGIAIFWMFSFLYYHHWRKPEKLFRYDVAEYYVYLPALFIYGDPDFYFLDSLENPVFAKKTSIYKLDNGKRISKMSPGMAIMYSPFFLFAHAVSILSESVANGYTRMYSFWVALSGLVYAWLGLLVLYRVLDPLYGKVTASLTIAAIGLGTNLLYYASSEPAMSHAAGFFLMTCGIMLTIRWHKSKRQLHGILLGLVLGLIVLVRPVNIFFALFPVLYGFRREKIFFKAAWKKPGALTGMVLSGSLVITLLMIYWKWKTGEFLYFSYQEEGFNFRDPRMWQCLFGFRKGWLIYTPVMFFALAGLFTRDKLLRPFIPALVIILPIIFYVLSSWWCWWYGGSFGFRPMVEWYALLAVPLASLIYVSRGVKRKITGVIVGILIMLNIFQTHQYNYTTIHWDAMTWQAYKKVFLRRLPPKNFDQYLDHPDYKRPGGEQ